MIVINESDCITILHKIYFEFTELISEHQNSFLSDPFLKRCLQRIIPKDVYQSQVEPDLTRFGAAVAGPIWYQFHITFCLSNNIEFDLIKVGIRDQFRIQS